MNILIIGSGGREHALAWKLKQSPLCKNLAIAPGNAGTALVGTNVAIDPNDFNAIANYCLTNDINMVVVGPEEPLVKGIYDYFTTSQTLQHIQIIGPSKDAAQLEGSKAFAKNFLLRNNIPTAAYCEFTSANYEAGIAYIKNHSLPIVLKADGLAAGKGVVICTNHIEALAEFELMIQQSKFGDASKKVVIEEFLTGIEMSVFVLTDGKNYLLLPNAKDYKRIGEGDTGANTGGMGAISPVPFANKAFMKKVVAKVVEPTIIGLQKAQLTYKGVIFIGLIKVNEEPFVIEYNCRFGDPETEVILPRINNDLVEVFSALYTDKLSNIVIDTNPLSAATVVAVSGGYPNNYEKGKVIDGLKNNDLDGTIVFHAGTAYKNEQVVTNGGRVLAVTSLCDDITGAAQQSNYMLEQIYFEDMYFRNDIGFEFMEE
jgi:phosphoribosylamine---glycine ligase